MDSLHSVYGHIAELDATASWFQTLSCPAWLCFAPLLAHFFIFFPTFPPPLLTLSSPPKGTYYLPHRRLRYYNFHWHYPMGWATAGVRFGVCMVRAEWALQTLPVLVAVGWGALSTEARRKFRDGAAALAAHNAGCSRWSRAEDKLRGRASFAILQRLLRVFKRSSLVRVTTKAPWSIGERSLAYLPLCILPLRAVGKIEMMMVASQAAVSRLLLM